MNKSNTNGHSKTWHYAEPDLVELMKQPILQGFASIKVGDHMMLMGGSSGKRIVRVISNIPVGRDNGIMEIKTVWSESSKYDTSKSAPTTSQWKSLRSNCARYYTPVPKPAPKPDLVPSPPAGAPRPPSVTTSQPGTISALNCIHAGIAEATKQADKIALQTWSNIGEIADHQVEANNLLREVLIELKAIRAAWEGK